MLSTLPPEGARPRPAGEEGATAVEYALLVGLIVVIVISSLALLGGNVDALFGEIAHRLGGGHAPGH